MPTGYALRIMFDPLLPPLYRQLRIKTELAKCELAQRLGVSRHTVGHYESGRTRPDADYVTRLIELSKCSRLEVVQMFCELLGELIERPVVICDPKEREPEEPHTVLERSDREARQLKRFITPSMFRTLTNQIRITRMMELTLERQVADLDQLTADCRAAAGRHAPCPTATPMGATGSPAGEPVLDNCSDGTTPERSTPKPKHPSKGTKP